MEEITFEPIVSEEERNFKVGEEGMQIEMDVPLIIYFCSQECKDEYFEPTNKQILKP